MVRVELSDLGSRTVGSCVARHGKEEGSAGKIADIYGGARTAGEVVSPTICLRCGATVRGMDCLSVTLTRVEMVDSV